MTIILLIMLLCIIIDHVSAFLPSSIIYGRARVLSPRSKCVRMFGSSTPVLAVVEGNISRLGTLQTLLTKRGAPGSIECFHPNDLVAVSTETPELISSLAGGTSFDELADLHPYLFPIAKSRSSGNYICAYRNPFVEEARKLMLPWPIVEAKKGGPGMNLLSLNSEHLMRRIICECDSDGKDDDLIRLYNEGLGQGLLREVALDNPYEVGSVERLGYGVNKYVLLRVGPFPDLYETMAKEHANRGDEQSSLIAAETANSKLSGFASTYRFYSRLLSTFPNRREESRDVARMCLRLPIPTIGLVLDNYKEVAVLCQVAEEEDSNEVALEKLHVLYHKMRQVEQDEHPNQGKTPEHVAIDEANHLINMAVFERKSWKDIRSKLSEHC